MLVPVELDTAERARSLLDYEIPQIPKNHPARNNSMLMELDDFGHEFDISSSNNGDFNYLKMDEPQRRPEQDVADRLRSIENFNNGEQLQQFTQQPVNLMGDFSGGMVDLSQLGELAMRNRSMTFHIPQAVQHEMMMGLGQSALEMQQHKMRPRRNPRLSFDFDDSTNRHKADDPRHDDD